MELQWSLTISFHVCPHNSNRDEPSPARQIRYLSGCDDDQRPGWKSVDGLNEKTDLWCNGLNMKGKRTYHNLNILERYDDKMFVYHCKSLHSIPYHEDLLVFQAWAGNFSNRQVDSDKHYFFNINIHLPSHIDQFEACAHHLTNVCLILKEHCFYQWLSLQVIL